MKVDDRANLAVTDLSTLKMPRAIKLGKSRPTLMSRRLLRVRGLSRATMPTKTCERTIQCLAVRGDAEAGQTTALSAQVDSVGEFIALCLAISAIRKRAMHRGLNW